MNEVATTTDRRTLLSIMEAWMERVVIGAMSVEEYAAKVAALVCECIGAKPAPLPEGQRYFRERPTCADCGRMMREPALATRPALEYPREEANAGSACTSACGHCGACT